MNYKRLNSDLIDLIELRNELGKLNFNDEAYDDMEDEIHEYEDTFNERYGETLEAIFEEIHNRICPDVEVLLPTAYLAKEYFPSVLNEDEFEIGPNAGVLVETVLEDAKGRPIDARMTVLPTPFRIVLLQKDDIRILWTAERPTEYNC